MLYPRMRKLIVSRCKSSPYIISKIHARTGFRERRGPLGPDTVIEFEIIAFERDFNSLNWLHGWGFITCISSHLHFCDHFESKLKFNLRDSFSLHMLCNGSKKSQQPKKLTEKIGCKNVFFTVCFTLQPKAIDFVTFFGCDLRRCTTERLWSDNLTTEKVEIGANFGSGISLVKIHNSVDDEPHIRKLKSRGPHESMKPGPFLVKKCFKCQKPEREYRGSDGSRGPRIPNRGHFGWRTKDLLVHKL